MYSDEGEKESIRMGWFGGGASNSGEYVVAIGGIVHGS